MGFFLIFGVLIAAALIYDKDVNSKNTSQSVSTQSSSVLPESPYELAERDALSNLAGLSDRARADKSAPGIHGEVSLPAAGGGSEVLAWQLGKVTAASAGKVTVRSGDGTTWTWQLTKDTDRTEKATPRKGDEVYVLGSRKGDTRTAGHLVNADVDAVEDGEPLLELPDGCAKEKKGDRLTVTCGSTEDRKDKKDGKKQDGKPKTGEQQGLEGASVPL
ncbi:hypothetical protein [Streptomyces albipurpureus]|uniref:Secreted protein n=1 Tax=Streptomyces albipurpureus TaxID=2897419 RepID=A0ABT0UH69_9ACTN|nr:hypothetical protein [Streptomyces sp. CWNU-1]MCM2387979.1 hypothetical protein [Streptomyces sp. CWNU-1]